jgi:hypothetical protein
VVSSLPAITLTEQHAVPLAQRTVPALQVIPHDVPSQVAAPWTGTAHAVHELPQLSTLVLLSHAELQAW